MGYPDWVLKNKTKGTEIRKIGNNYYLYEIRSKWDKEKKRARKITEKFLGKITEDGIIKPRHQRMAEAFIKDRKELLELHKKTVEEKEKQLSEMEKELEKERQNTVCLEMLILDIDKELGLMNIVKKMDEKNL
jgi:hypothetical protein